MLWMRCIITQSCNVEVVMKTFKKLGLKVRCGGTLLWYVNGVAYNGNKGQAVLAYLNEHYVFTGGRWVAK
jgi:hypothetical protein